ncbi:response regulator [Rhizobium ruizarguesonis]|nr:response regulator [Rhizobium ruizarguesonis]
MALSNGGAGMVASPSKRDFRARFLGSRCLSDHTCRRWMHCRNVKGKLPGSSQEQPMNSIIRLDHIERSTISAAAPTVLIVDPLVDTESALAREFRKRGCAVFFARDEVVALRIGASAHLDIAIVELRLGDGCGFEVIDGLANRQPSCNVFVSSDYCDLKATVCAVKRGARDVFPKSMPVMLLVGLVLGDDLDALAAKACLERPERIRHDHILGVYAALDRNVSRAARRLSMHRRTLQRYLGQHGLS